MATSAPNRAVQSIEARIARRFDRTRDPAWRAPNPDLPVGSDTLPEIRHIVVLMMENHSFDNYLGVLGRGDGLPRGAEGAPNAANAAINGPPVVAHHLLTTKQPPRVPTQAWDASHEQWAEGTNAGFVRSAERQHASADPSIAMGYWTDTDLPFYYGLARVFPGRRPVVLLLPRPHVSEPAVPAGGHRPWPHYRQSRTHIRLPPERHRVRPAGEPSDQLGELSPDPAPRAGAESAVWAGTAYVRHAEPAAWSGG